MYLNKYAQLYNKCQRTEQSKSENSHCSLYPGGTLDTEVISSIPFPFYHLHLRSLMLRIHNALQFKISRKIKMGLMNQNQFFGENKAIDRDRETTRVDDENDVAAGRGGGERIGVEMRCAGL